MTLSQAELAGMRRTVSRTVFLHLATAIVRDAAGETFDINGHPIVTEAEVLVDVPCFFWLEDEEMVASDDINAVISRPRIKFAEGTDVRVGDQITQVLDRKTRAVMAEGLQVREVLPNKASVICELWEAD